MSEYPEAERKFQVIIELRGDTDPDSIIVKDGPEFTARFVGWYAAIEYVESIVKIWGTPIKVTINAY